MEKGTWEDVTGECELTWGYKGHEIKVVHDGVIVAIVGQRVNHINSGGLGKIGDKAYRVTVTPDSDPLWSGKIEVEHFIPDPEPVIAYKAVIEKDGGYVSTFAGSPPGQQFDELTYRMGQTTTSSRGTGIHCADTLEVAMRNYPPADSDDRREGFDRKDGRVVILKVEGIGVKGEADSFAHRESVVFPSVKVLSVAWEEEKKEEWVDVTEECTVRLLGSGFVSIRHNDCKVAEVGHKLWGKPNNGYRVTFTESDYAGFSKVEKRND